jgi:competence protein ComEC
VILLFIVLSFVNCNYNSKSVLTQYIDEDIDCVAKIKSVNNTTENSSNYNSYNATAIKLNGKIMKYKENTIVYMDKMQKLDTNTIVNIKGQVSDVEFGKNFILFNYKSYLRSKKIYATIFCTDKSIIIDDNYSFIIKLTNNFKLYTEKLFTSKLNKKNSEIILSMILGDTDYLDDGLYDNIRKMGLAHIFAVSGLHIGLLYAAMSNSFKIVGFNRRISWIITWSLLWSYGFLIGFPVSVMRALVMFTFLFGSELFYRRYNSLNSIALSALILIIINPFWIFDVGFILSFSAALSLVLFNKYIQKNVKNKIFKTLCMYLFIQIFTLPIVIYFFNYLPLLGIIYNLLLIPIFTIVLIASFIFLIFNKIFMYTLAVPFRLFDYFLCSLRYIINMTENIKFNGIIMATPSIYEIIFIYMTIFYILYSYKTKHKYFLKIGYLIITAFYMITYVIIPITDKSLYFNILDVGQGMFSTAKYKNYDFIFDCGSTSNKNLGEYVVVPYLTKKGINEIDGVFISHWDSDHYSGAYNLIDCDNIHLRNILSSWNNEDIKAKITIVKKGDNFILDNKFKITILSPKDDVVFTDKNNLSLVILLNYNERRILIPGDIESETENEIISDLVKSDIVILPHHGSKTSSTEAFVNTLSPNFAVISYGKNSYGIPSEEVLMRYEKVKSNILSTFYNGEINFVLNGDDLYYNTYTGLKSDNYYELYLVWIVPKLVLMGLFISWMIIRMYSQKKRLNYEL